MLPGDSAPTQIAMNITESANQMIGTGSIGRTFYGLFLGLYPDFRDFFRGTDMDRQGNLLINAMVLIESHYRNPEEGLGEYLNCLGAMHQEMGIAPHDYACWKDAMLHTLQEFHGDHWSLALNDDWDAAIEKAIGEIIAGYSGERRGLGSVSRPAADVTALSVDSR